MEAGSIRRQLKPPMSNVGVVWAHSRPAWAWRSPVHWGRGGGAMQSRFLWLLSLPDLTGINLSAPSEVHSSVPRSPHPVAPCFPPASHFCFWELRQFILTVLTWRVRSALSESSSWGVSGVSLTHIFVLHSVYFIKT